MPTHEVVIDKGPQGTSLRVNFLRGPLLSPDEFQKLFANGRCSAGIGMEKDGWMSFFAQRMDDGRFLRGSEFDEIMQKEGPVGALRQGELILRDGVRVVSHVRMRTQDGGSDETYEEAARRILECIAPKFLDKEVSIATYREGSEPSGKVLGYYNKADRSYHNTEIVGDVFP